MYLFKRKYDKKIISTECDFNICREIIIYLNIRSCMTVVICSWLNLDV